MNEQTKTQPKNMQLLDSDDTDEVYETFYVFLTTCKIDYPNIEVFHSDASYVSSASEEVVLSVNMPTTNMPSQDSEGQEKHKQKTCENCMHRRRCKACHLTCICGMKFSKLSLFREHIQ